MDEIGLGSEWPGWLQIHIKNATNADRQRWTGFAMAVIQDVDANRIALRKETEANDTAAIAARTARLAEMNGYDKPNDVNTRPDDKFWQSTPKRKEDHDRYLRDAAKRSWTITTRFDPGKAISDVGHAISSIPVVGDLAHIVGEAAVAPLNLAKNIATGERLDHALVGALKDQVKIVKDVAPYAQTVVSLVPGIGTGVAAAIGAGAALAEGKSIDEAAKAAIRGAIPGGPIAAAGFDAAMKVASGENVAKAAIESARNLVPDGPARKAFDIGVSVATGEKIQNALAKGLVGIAPEGLQAVLAAGQQALSSTPGLAEAIKSVAPGDATRGFQMAAGLLGHEGMNEKALTAVRSQLPAAVRQGFDAALKTQEKHLPWLGNVVQAVASTPMAAKAAIAAAVVPPKAAPHAPEPPRVAPHAPEPPKAAPHAPEPPKPAPHAPEPPKPTPKPPEPSRASVPSAPAATVPAAAITSTASGDIPYPPYPSSLTSGVHGLGATPAYPPYPGALSAPPHLPHPAHAFHASPGGERHPASGIRWSSGRAPWWGVPFTPNTPSLPANCRVWGAPVDIPPAMATAARVALSVSKGQPSMVQGPDGVVYLFAFENGAITARPCAG